MFSFITFDQICLSIKSLLNTLINFSESISELFQAFSSNAAFDSENSSKTTKFKLRITLFIEHEENISKVYV